LEEAEYNEIGDLLQVLVQKDPERDQDQQEDYFIFFQNQADIM